MLGLAEGTHTEVPKVLVINLDRSPQRWESAQVQFVSVLCQQCANNSTCLHIIHIYIYINIFCIVSRSRLTCGDIPILRL